MLRPLRESGDLKVKTHGKRKSAPKGVVIHYTVGSDQLEGAPAWPSVSNVVFCENKYGFGYQVIVDFEGKLWRLAPDNEIVYHAKGYNSSHLGLTFLYEGPASRKRGDAWVSGRHPRLGTAWFPPIREAQLDGLAWVAAYLLEEACQGPKELLYHEDLDPDRKCDPGSAFPRSVFEGRVTEYRAALGA